MSNHSLEALRVAAYDLRKKISYFRKSIANHLISEHSERAASELHESIDSFRKLLKTYRDRTFPQSEIDSEEIMEEVANYIE